MLLFSYIAFSVLPLYKSKIHIKYIRRQKHAGDHADYIERKVPGSVFFRGFIVTYLNLRLGKKSDKRQNKRLHRKPGKKVEYDQINHPRQPSKIIVYTKLMQAMFELGKERGIPLPRLRFKINGIEE